MGSDGKLAVNLRGKNKKTKTNKNVVMHARLTKTFMSKMIRLRMIKVSNSEGKVISNYVFH